MGDRNENGGILKIKRKTKTYESNSSTNAAGGNKRQEEVQPPTAQRSQPYRMMDINELDEQHEILLNRRNTTNP